MIKSKYGHNYGGVEVIIQQIELYGEFKQFKKLMTPQTTNKLPKKWSSQ